MAGTQSLHNGEEHPIIPDEYMTILHLLQRREMLHKDLLDELALQLLDALHKDLLDELALQLLDEPSFHRQTQHANNERATVLPLELLHGRLLLFLETRIPKHSVRSCSPEALRAISERRHHIQLLLASRRALDDMRMGVGASERTTRQVQRLIARKRADDDRMATRAREQARRVQQLVARKLALDDEMKLHLDRFMERRVSDSCLDCSPQSLNAIREETLRVKRLAACKLASNDRMALRENGSERASLESLLAGLDRAAAADDAINHIMTQAGRDQCLETLSSLFQTGTRPHTRSIRHGSSSEAGASDTQVAKTTSNGVPSNVPPPGSSLVAELCNRDFVSSNVLNDEAAVQHESASCNDGNVEAAVAQDESSLLKQQQARPTTLPQDNETTVSTKKTSDARRIVPHLEENLVSFGL